MTISTSQTSIEPTNRPIRGAATISPAEAAARMMSETAHDIRAPLATIRESIRLVHDGDLGEISADQKMCLEAAIDQCNCLDQMVGEMVQLERLRTGIPRVRRLWTNVSEIQKSITQTLRPWALPRGINVLWDITDSKTRIFADASMIRRMVVNLVANAIRVTAEGGSVLIRAERTSNGESLRWSIVDRGAGISESEMVEIAKRQISLGGGEGLGLSICRQLSALHFSQLRIESRLGTGTAVSFETAAGGPGAVANCWAKWRVGQREPLRKPINREEQINLTTSDDSAAQQVRFDVPTTVVELASEGTSPQFDDRIAAGTVRLGAAMSRQSAETFDKILQSQLRMFDFVYRVDSRQWVWVFDADIRQAAGRIDTVIDAAKQKVRGIRLSWSDPQMIPLDKRRTASRLSDLLVRQSLAATKLSTAEFDPTHFGKPGVGESATATRRLHQEMQRLSTRMTSRSKDLRGQAVRIRPNF